MSNTVIKDVGPKVPIHEEIVVIKEKILVDVFVLVHQISIGNKAVLWKVQTEKAQIRNIEERNLHSVFKVEEGNLILVH